MWRLEVVTSWTSDEFGNRPAILDLLGPGDSAVDITGQAAENLTPDPNLVVWEVTCSEDTLIAIEADVDHLILISEEIIDIVPGEAP